MIYFLITIIVVFILQGIEDENRQKASSVKFYEKTILWHNIAFAKNIILWSFVAIYTSGFTLQALLLLTSIAFTRLVVLNTTINLYRGQNKIWYFSESSSYPDKLFYKYPKLFYFSSIMICMSLWIILIINPFNSNFLLYLLIIFYSW